MTNIVAILRDRAHNGYGQDREMAAAEIERLRAEVELWKDRCAAERQAHEATIRQWDDDRRGEP